MNPLTRRTPTTADFNFAGNLGLYSTIPGTCLCFLVLVFYGITALNRKGRKHLDRVSFRLLVYSLVFNILYGISFAVTAAQTGPGSLCTFGAFAVNFTLTFAIFFTTCIAINLELVLVHRLSGKMMEKYYIIGTTILGIVLNVPPYGLHQFGFHEASGVCWYKNPDDKLRLHWLIGTQSFWMAFAAFIEILNTRYLQKASTPGHTHSLASSSGAGTTRSGTSATRTTSFWSGTSSTQTAADDVSRKYRGVIIRIALYPIASLLINSPTIALDIYSVVVPLTNDLDFRLLVVDLILYGLRTLLYAILAFGDPSFIRAVKEIRGKPTSRRSTGDTGHTVSHARFAGGRRQADSAITTMGGGPLAVNVELQKTTFADDYSMATQTVKGGTTSQDDSTFSASTHKPATSGSVNFASGILSSQTEAQRRTQFDAEKDDDDWRFEREL
ncbi:hypothetical protein D9758_000944 [Tetrapyrgos nigripes]|uniref:G-protein coupled receptors family 2 profile 2 domain-containing protein n=1 Tax=Tetrapyrgos nigripes TaxID=182062 RepID=A0A8H5GZ61_9AGAR|nr:hypothetical protein D9758_000944 [Tetrapyrgos nigripes]